VHERAMGEKYSATATPGAVGKSRYFKDQSLVVKRRSLGEIPPNREYTLSLSVFPFMVVEEKLADEIKEYSFHYI